MSARRRSSYGAYVAHGLIMSGGEVKPGICACCDDARDTLECHPWAADTYRRVVMRHQMRASRPPMPRGPRRWRKKR